MYAGSPLLPARPQDGRGRCYGGDMELDEARARFNALLTELGWSYVKAAWKYGRFRMGPIWRHGKPEPPFADLPAYILDDMRLFLKANYLDRR